MAITTILFFFVARLQLGWALIPAAALTAGLLAIDGSLLTANLAKLVHGGWVPLLVGTLLYLLMSVWRQGRTLLGEVMARGRLEVSELLADIERRKPPRVPGTAVFMTRQVEGVPQVLLHHLKHNGGVLHQQVLLLSVVAENVPRVAVKRRLQVIPLGQGVFRVLLRHGFMETPDLNQALSRLRHDEVDIDLAHTSYFLGRETVLPTGPAKMARWRKKVFGLMSRNANPATAFFGIPPNRVIELGAQIAL
jgi:KUP system potassium uptake protein